MSNQSEKLFKSSTDKHIMGVCGGLAELFFSQVYSVNLKSTFLRKT